MRLQTTGDTLSETKSKLSNKLVLIWKIMVYSLLLRKSFEKTLKIKEETCPLGWKCTKTREFVEIYVINPTLIFLKPEIVFN